LASSSAKLTLTLAAVLFLTITNPALPARGAEVNTNFDCYQCHSKKEITPWITQTWAGSKHAAEGVMCGDCHGNHDGGFDTPDFTALPGPDVCQKCHPLNVKDTMSSAHAKVTKCTSCHPRHTFSLNVARNPRICSTCHSGNRHVDGYANSKMGVVYTTEGPGNSATCQTCHMPEGTHNVDLTIKNRDEMLKVCNRCHSASFAGKALAEGNLVIHW